MDNWATVKRLFEAAIEVEPDQRGAFLDQACGDAPGVREEVQSLLQHEDAAASFLEIPALEVTAKQLVPAISLVGRTLGHYHVRLLLGAGGMGEVYLAHDPRLDRHVALKILPSDLAPVGDRMQRFVREARAASALSHPNVATIHDVGESDGVHFIVMEHVEGTTIASRLAERPLTAEETIDIAAQVADALDAAHARGITHRDIKPANLMLTTRGRVTVLDFGVAKISPSEDSATGNESTGMTGSVAGAVIGSVPYMSPEQVRGRNVDHLSDVFSLGVSMYEMATGRLPFSGDTPADTMARILQVAPAPMTEVTGSLGADLERIIFKCLEKEGAQRYQTARELLADLQRLKRHNAALDREHAEGLRRHNLPALLTTFVGRRREIDHTSALLGGTRLVTLTGAGGCGKTRLALQVAAEHLARFRDGIWVVDLAPLSDADLVPPVVAAAVGIRATPGRAIADSLVEYFRPRSGLLVLDNCEHLIGAGAQLVELLLRAAPELRVLATSREGLGIAGETVWRVPSMSTPDATAPSAPYAAMQYEAVRLFVDRAVAVQPDFALTEDNTSTVVEICRRLDGIPLAIELAAARLNVLAVDQIRVRLDDRFHLLTGGSRTAIARQRTLEATIDWSYDLLSETEKTALCRLSVFSSAWTLEAAEAVCTGSGIEHHEMLDLLSRLVEKSLVNVEDATSGHVRYRCLETVRQYGRDRLVRSGDAGRVRDAHLEFFVAFIRRAEPELLKEDQAIWLRRVQAECDNLRAALEWCLVAHANEDLGLEMTAAMSWFWIKRGHLAEGRVWIERALATPAPSLALRVKALNRLASIAFFLGDFKTTAVAAARGEALARDTGAWTEVAWSLGIQALLAFESGDSERSVRLAAECRQAAAAGGDPWPQGPALECLAYQAMMRGDHEEACQLAEEALDLSRHAGDVWGMAICLSDLALFRVLQGGYAEAERLCAEALMLTRGLSDRLLTTFFLSILAGAQAGRGRHRRAAQLWGAMHALLESVASTLQPSHQMWIGDRFISEAEAQLGAAAFTEALEEGRAMSFQQAVEFALTPGS